MTCVAIPLSPMKEWRDWPAATEHHISIEANGVPWTRCDQGWREGAVEQLLARHPRAILDALGHEPITNPIVLRQLADLDVVIVNGHREVIAIELKKKGGDNPGEALIQLASNIRRAHDILAAAFPGVTVRAVLSGDWKREQAVTAKLATCVAWERATQTCGDEPRVLLHATVERDGRPHLLLATPEAMPEVTRAGSNIAPAFAKALTEGPLPLDPKGSGRFSARRHMPNELSLTVEVSVDTVILRFEAKAAVRDAMLDAVRLEDCKAKGALAFCRARQAAHDVLDQRLFAQVEDVGQRWGLKFWCKESLAKEPVLVSEATRKLLDALITASADG